MSASPKAVFWNGVFKQNAAIVQLLGLCPTLAVSNSIVNGVSLGLATVLVMALSNLVIALFRNFIPYEIRIPVFILIIAALVTVVDLSFSAYMHSLYLVLGIYVPLIVTNCIVLARVEAFAAKNGVLVSIFDGLGMGVGLTLALAILGAAREIIGSGTLFGGIDQIIPGTHAVTLFGEHYPGFLIAILPPGAFIALGFLIALQNLRTAQQAQKAKAQNLQPAPAPGKAQAA